MKEKIMKNYKILVYILIIVVSFTILSVSLLIYKEKNETKPYQFDYLNKLNEMSKANKKIKEIMDNRNLYPIKLLNALSENEELTDFVYEYTSKKGKISSDNIGEVKKGEYPLLLQYDERWGYSYYDNDVLGINGCGPTNVSMVIAGLTGKNNITPSMIANYSEKNNYVINGSTKWSFFTEGVEYFGIKGTVIENNIETINTKLKNKEPIICSIGKGDFTNEGHFILLTQIKDDKLVINDSYSKKRSSILWEYDNISNQIKQCWSFKLK